MDRAADEARRLHPELVVHALSRYGDPRSILLELSTQAHLMVLGSRGRGALTSLLLGSVSSAVSAHAECPIVVCRPVPVRTGGRGIVVGADGTGQSLPVIEFAYQQASVRRLPLTVLHVYWDAVAAAAGFRRDWSVPLNAADLEELKTVLGESVAGFGEKYPDVRVTLSLKHGLVDEAMNPRQGAWDLIVVGRHPMDSTSRILAGTMATAVLERAWATVAVVPEAP